MKYILNLTFLILFISFSYSQNEEQHILKTVISLFDAMRAEDSLKADNLFSKEATSASWYMQDGIVQKESGSIRDFISAIGKKHQKVWDERIYAVDIKVDEFFAQCWTDYVFFYGDTIHHCGTNFFSLIKENGVWKIADIQDTRINTSCHERIITQDSVKAHINGFLDCWHSLAAKGDTNYFTYLDSAGIYIGTDNTEHWTANKFKSLYKPYFDQGKGWDFKAINRHVYVSGDLNQVWFDELLETWMGPCRASGVIRFYDNKWHILHYHLSMTIPNDKVNEVIEVIGED